MKRPAKKITQGDYAQGNTRQDDVNYAWTPEQLRALVARYMASRRRSYRQAVAQHECEEGEVLQTTSQQDFLFKRRLKKITDNAWGGTLEAHIISDAIFECTGRHFTIRIWSHDTPLQNPRMKKDVTLERRAEEINGLLPHPGFELRTKAIDAKSAKNSEGGAPVVYTPTVVPNKEQSWAIDLLFLPMSARANGVKNHFGALWVQNELSPKVPLAAKKDQPGLHDYTVLGEDKYNKQHYFRYQYVLGDGNCFYHAMCSLLDYHVSDKCTAHNPDY